MVIEQTNTEVIIKLPLDTDKFGLQRIINYLKYKEAIKHSEANDTHANELATNSKKLWWDENKARFIK
jgi:hypothetical protein